MNRNILLLLFAVITIHAQEFFSLGFTPKIPLNTNQVMQHHPMESLMLAIQNMHKNNSLKSGFQFTSHLELQKEKTFWGMRAPVSEKLILRYLNWQREGELRSMQKELIRIEGKITQHHAFKRFKWEHRKSLLLKVINNETTKNLSIIKNGTLEQAEALMYQLEHPIAAQFADDYIEIKKEECLLARQILEKRADYRNKIQQKQNITQTIATNPNNTNQETTNNPIDIDRLFKQKVTADPQTDFKEYARQIQGVRNDLKSKGLYTAEQVPLFIKGVIKSFVKGFANIAQHPDLYIQKIIESNLELAKEIVLFFIDVYSAPEELYVNERELQLYQDAAIARGEALIRKYNELCVIIPQMNREDWENLTSSIILDGVIFYGAGKGIRIVKNAKIPASILESPLLSKINTNLERSLAKQAEIVTAEGVVFKAPQAPEETGLLKNIAVVRAPYKPLWWQELELKPLGLGSTGRSTPANLHEQLVLKDIMLNPTKGRFIKLPNGITDMRWPKEQGWMKMSYRNDEFGIEIHYVAQWENGILKALDDFKFKDHAR